jgi:CubicO group peptidase (beta-lactamase class C family)
MLRLLVVGATALLSSLVHASPVQTPFASTSRHSILDANTTAFLDAAREKYGIKGVAVTVVQEPEEDGGEWISDYGLFGVANAVGDNVTPDVSANYKDWSERPERLMQEMKYGLNISHNYT